MEEVEIATQLEVSIERPWRFDLMTTDRITQYSGKRIDRKTTKTIGWLLSGAGLGLSLAPLVPLGVGGDGADGPGQFAAGVGALTGVGVGVAGVWTLMDLAKAGTFEGDDNLGATLFGKRQTGSYDVKVVLQSDAEVKPRPVPNQSVWLRDASGVLATGQTDERGRVLLTVPIMEQSDPNLEIVVGSPDDEPIRSISAFSTPAFAQQVSVQSNALVKRRKYSEARRLLDRNNWAKDGWVRWCAYGAPSQLRSMGRRDFDVASSLLAVPRDSCSDVLRKTEAVVLDQAKAAASRCEPSLARKWLGVLGRSANTAEVEKLLADTQTSCWSSRQARAARQCRKYAVGLSARKGAVFSAQAVGNEDEVRRTTDALLDWINEQEAGATGEALEEFGALMDEMDAYERANRVDLTDKKRALVEAARQSCP